MSEKIFLVDTNLGFDIEDPKWQQFFHKYDVTPVQDDDLDKIFQKVKNHEVTVCYFPATNLLYLKPDTYYTPIANALFTYNQSFKTTSVVVVPKESSISSLSELKGKSYGDINSHCTSSYYAMGVLLKKHGFSIHDFFSDIQGVGAWQLQIDAVIAGRVDATMVLESVWNALSSNKEKTKVIDQLGNLPSPVVICAVNAEPDFKRDLSELLFINKQKPVPHSLFNGFVPFQSNFVETFCTEVANAFV